MTSALENYINRTVAVITSDGRMIVGTLKGFDQTINLILDESHERVFSSSQGVEQVVLGLYIVRGDNVAVIGEIDKETDSALDLGNEYSTYTKNTQHVYIHILPFANCDSNLEREYLKYPLIKHNSFDF
uniref:U6 snRNA-associated Sm-like protein LSm8 n=1 Tax=Canis lupus dingo TaxID=286419 RepID=A0A8C0KIQ5_CANLU